MAVLIDAISQPSWAKDTLIAPDALFADARRGRGPSYENFGNLLQNVHGRVGRGLFIFFEWWWHDGHRVWCVGMVVSRSEVSFGIALTVVPRKAGGYSRRRRRMLGSCAAIAREHAPGIAGFPQRAGNNLGRYIMFATKLVPIPNGRFYVVCNFYFINHGVGMK